MKPERRFIIFEDDMTGYNACHQQLITESELRRRLRTIAPMDLTLHDGSDAVDNKDIYYLLYGVWPKSDD